MKLPSATGSPTPGQRSTDNNNNKPALTAYLISVWHYFRCDTYTVKPYDEVPPSKLNLDITSLAPDLYPVPFLKESGIKFLGGEGVWCGTV